MSELNARMRGLKKIVDPRESQTVNQKLMNVVYAVVALATVVSQLLAYLTT